MALLRTSFCCHCTTYSSESVTLLANQETGGHPQSRLSQQQTEAQRMEDRKLAKGTSQEEKTGEENCVLESAGSAGPSTDPMKGEEGPESRGVVEFTVGDSSDENQEPCSEGEDASGDTIGALPQNVPNLAPRIRKMALSHLSKDDMCIPPHPEVKPELIDNRRCNPEGARLSRTMSMKDFLCVPRRARAMEQASLRLNEAQRIPRFGSRRNALNNPELMAMPQQTRERVQQEAVVRKSDLRRKLSLPFKAMMEGELEVDLL